ncbi:phage protease [Harryflintia acetispora]|uniref:Phage I-like protein n=1 Tax=Harryflintia acetispora TaxID=1849041 RepID=A0A9X8UJ05_9FIRM|nr:phage protease [Harryflintia acetispora]TCL43214.1 phage I-like protein [Harryflintia acetispora]
MIELFACSAGRAEVSGAPEVIKILPLGHVTTTEGSFEVDAESYKLMQEQYRARRLDLPIDYEHQTLKDVQAPAAGWIKELVLQEDAIAARVEWTDKGREYLEHREYRYLSPVVLVRAKDKKAVGLHSAALTNKPAIDRMFAIVNSDRLPPWGAIPKNKKGGNQVEELVKKIAAALGLGEEASEEQLMQRLGEIVGEAKDLKAKQEAQDQVVANKNVCELLGLKAGAPASEVSARIVELKDGGAGNVEAELRALKGRLADRDAEDMVELALKDGKITPAQREWAKEYALKDPSGFKAFADKAPQVVPLSEIAPGGGKEDKKKVSEETLAICKQVGVSPEDLEKFGKED